jgi:hypothetical protein
VLVEVLLPKLELLIDDFFRRDEDDEVLSSVPLVSSFEVLTALSTISPSSSSSGYGFASG